MSNGQTAQGVRRHPLTFRNGGQRPLRNGLLICIAVEMALFGTIWHCMRGSLSRNARSRNELRRIKKRAGTLASVACKVAFFALRKGVLSPSKRRHKGPAGVCPAHDSPSPRDERCLISSSASAASCSAAIESIAAALARTEGRSE
jgi:hypothetical protein